LAAQNSFILFKKYSTHQKKKVKALIPDCVREMIEPAQGEDENYSSDDESQAATSTAPTPPTPKRPPVKEPADRLQGGLRKRKMVQVPPTEKGKDRHRECVPVVQNTNEEKKPVLYARLVVWHSAKLCVCRISHAEKNTQQVCKN
jgi:hypothetical protein